MLESSGLAETWVEACLYSNVTTSQILIGNHLAAHQMSLQVLFDVWTEAFFEHNPVLHELRTPAVQILNVREDCRN